MTERQNAPHTGAGVSGWAARLLSGWILSVTLLGQGLAGDEASRLIFPRLTFEAETLIGLAVLNPGSEDAVIEFRAYDETGQLIAAPDFQNPREIEIGAGRQFADITSSLFGSLPEDSRGWIKRRETFSV